MAGKKNKRGAFKEALFSYYESGGAINSLARN